MVLISCSIVLSVCLSYSAMNLKRTTEEITMADVESISQDEINKCGNVTFIPDEALREAQCWNGATHKKCKKQDRVCCNPVDQTDCAPIIK